MKKILILLPLVILVCLYSGCQNKSAMAELEAYKIQDAQEKENIELAKRYIEAINQGNFEAFRELLSPDYAIFSPPGRSEQSSLDKHIENYKAAAQEFNPFTWEIEDLIAAADKVTGRIMVSGIYQGNAPDLNATGKQLSFSLITIMRMEDGKIAEEWVIDDMLGLARQLGMELKPKEEK